MISKILRSEVLKVRCFYNQTVRLRREMMRKELWVLRHAKSSWSDPTLDDFKRPLKKRGKLAATTMGDFMAREGLVPDLVLSSGAKRAKHTTRRVCQILGVKANFIFWENQLYHGGVSDALDLLNNIPDGIHRVLLVGHNPTLEALVDFLSLEPLPTPADGKLIPTATLVRLEIEPAWASLKSGCGRVQNITRPKWLLT